jgi:hypothetical protein
MITVQGFGASPFELRPHKQGSKVQRFRLQRFRVQRFRVQRLGIAGARFLVDKGENLSLNCACEGRKFFNRLKNSLWLDSI